MDQTYLELFSLCIFVLNLFITGFILWRAYGVGNFKKALFAAIGGVGAAVAVLITGMTVCFLLQFFIDYPLEIALTVVLIAAACVIPACAVLLQKM